MDLTKSSLVIQGAHVPSECVEVTWCLFKVKKRSVIPLKIFEVISNCNHEVFKQGEVAPTPAIAVFARLCFKQI